MNHRPDPFFAGLHEVKCKNCQLIRPGVHYCSVRGNPESLANGCIFWDR